MIEQLDSVDPLSCVVVIAFFTLATSVAVGLRLYARIWVTKTVAWDDYWLVCSQVLLLVVLAIFLVIGISWRKAERNEDAMSNDHLNLVSRS